jgi:hypothetical protein
MIQFLSLYAIDCIWRGQIAKECIILSLLSGANKILALLGCYAAQTST